MPRFAANLTLLFTEVDFLDRFHLAANAGFTGAEFLFPYQWPASAIRHRLTLCQLQPVLFNLPPGNWDAGERGIACHPDRIEEFREGVDLALAYATELQCTQLNCLAGIRPGNVSPETAWKTLEENVRYAARRLAPSGITLMVEAINSKVDMPGFLIDSSDKAYRLIQAIGCDNVKYQYDIYHMQIMEGDLIRTLTRYIDHIGHVQFADNPGRHEPGTGEICLDAVFRALDKLSYKGWVSAEYRPSQSTESTLSWLAPYKHYQP